MLNLLRRLWSWLRRPQDIDPEMVETALLLTDAVPNLATIKMWTPRQRLEAFLWAWSLHIHASDNDDYPVPPEPPHVKALPRYDWRSDR